MVSTAQTLSEMIKKQASKVWPKQQLIPKIETNWNLYEILKAWPSKSQATLPLKVEPIFVPSKLSEAPITLSSIISWYNKTKANLSDLIQKPISNITNRLSNEATDIAASWFENLWQQLQKEVERKYIESREKYENELGKILRERSFLSVWKSYIIWKRLVCYRESLLSSMRWIVGNAPETTAASVHLASIAAAIMKNGTFSEKSVVQPACAAR